MTAINRPVRRETSVTRHGRPLMVELHAGFLVLRAKKTRLRVTVGYDAILDLGYKLLAREAAAQKAAKRKAAGKCN